MQDVQDGYRQPVPGYPGWTICPVEHVGCFNCDRPCQFMAGTLARLNEVQATIEARRKAERRAKAEARANARHSAA